MRWRTWKGIVALAVIPLLAAVAVIACLAAVGEDADRHAACGPGDRLLVAGSLESATEAYTAVLSDPNTSSVGAECASAGLGRIRAMQCAQLDAYIAAGVGSGDAATKLRADLVSTPGRETPCADIVSTPLPVPSASADPDASAGSSLASHVTAGIDHLLAERGFNFSAGLALLATLAGVALLVYALWVVYVRRYDPGRIQTAKFHDRSGQPSAEAEARFREAIGYLGERLREPLLAPASFRARTAERIAPDDRRRGRRRRRRVSVTPRATTVEPDGTPVVRAAGCSDFDFVRLAVVDFDEDAPQDDVGDVAEHTPDWVTRLG